MTLHDLFYDARQGDRNALESIYLQFQYFIRGRSKYKGKFDEDLYQDLCEILIRCVYTFPL